MERGNVGHVRTINVTSASIISHSRSLTTACTTSIPADAHEVARWSTCKHSPIVVGSDAIRGRIVVDLCRDVHGIGITHARVNGVRRRERPIIS